MEGEGKGTDKVSPSESVERPWATNDKLTYDVVMSHNAAMMKYGEIALAQAVAFQQKSNDAYLTERDIREKQRVSQDSASFTQRLEHENELETQRQENNRFTLDRLYGVYPEESVGIVAIASALVDILKKEGTIPEK